MGQTTIKQRQIAGGLDGWIPAGETWTYASADDPTYTFTIASDVTTKYSAGMKIKLTQGTVKYFIITAVSTYSGGNTTITVYGGTDYDLANSAISANAYSMMKSPQGFPMSPAKWSVVYSQALNSSQSTPTADAWYNIGSPSLTIPIGAWRVGYQSAFYTVKGSASFAAAYFTLSTANNSESDYSNFRVSFINTGTDFIGTAVCYPRNIILESKTTYYINQSTPYASTSTLTASNHSNTVIQAVCAYL